MSLEVKRFGRKGRGVVTSQPIKKGEHVETCHVVIVPQEQMEHLGRTSLYNYYFSWGQNAAIALGFGSLYNHSENPNVEVTRDFKSKCLVMNATRNIRPDEELTISYGALWFDAK